MASDAQQRIASLTGRDFWRTADLPHREAPSLWLADGPHGLRKSRDAAAMGLADPVPATCFPTAAALAASWDPELVEDVGRAIGREAREQGVHVVLGPGLNLKRHPFGGRSFEYFSEDPLLSGRLAAAWVRGCQSEGVGACLKHFVANNQERQRMVLDAVIDERTLRELYLRGFEIAVAESAPASVMAAYNRINGTYATEHPLVADVLRGEWGFEGFVVSDWGAVADRVASLRAGLDLEMPGTGRLNHGVLEAALQDGRLSSEHVDRAEARLVKAAQRYGRPPARIDPDLQDAHHALARRAAAASCVLLRNAGDVLPIHLSGDLGLAGTLADDPRYQGAGSSGVAPHRVVSIRQAFDARLGSVRFAPGYALQGPTDPTWLEAAVALAADVSTMVLVAGLPAQFESEGFDRTSLTLPEDQVALIEAVAKVCDRVVVVLCNGSPVAMPWADQVAAIVEAYLGGQALGEGVVDVLVGDVNPSGRLPETFVDRVEDHLSHKAWPLDGRQVCYREGLFVGYRWFDTVERPVRFPFGHGLSYTSFDYGPLTAEVGDRTTQVRFGLTNTGSVAGAEVVQLYVHRPQQALYRPDQELQAFEKVFLEPGERREVAFALDRRAFASWSVALGRWVVEPGPAEVRVGASSRDIRARARFVVASTDKVPTDEAPVAYRNPRAASPPDEADFAVLYGRRWSPPRPRRPFHRNSTLGDLHDTWLGRGLYRVAMQQAVRTLGGGSDSVVRRMVEAAVAELPLRGLVTTAQVLSWDQLDALVATLDGRPWQALRTLLNRRRSA